MHLFDSAFVAPAENAPPALAPYLGRLLRVDETIPALGAAEQSDSDLRLTPVNGGWLATIGDGSQRPSTRRAARRRARVGPRAGPG